MGHSEKIKCTGKTTIQDYVPRNYAISFGFYCDFKGMSTLKGLEYNISIYDQSNETKCSPVPHEHYNDVDCRDFYSHMSLPNVIGNTDFKSILAVINYLKSLEAALNFVLEPAFTKPLCYKHLVEALCHTVLPKCDPDSGQVIHPCKETCEELIDGCIEKSLFILHSLGVLNKRFLAHLAQNINGDYRSNNLINCDYLPSCLGTIPCFYKPVTCHGPPPSVTNATIVTEFSPTNIYVAPAKIEYSCQNETLQMKDGNGSTCLYSGQWSDPPQCVEEELYQVENESRESPLLIVLPVLVPFVFLYLVIFITIRCRQKTISNLTRNKAFDAFVSFAFDADNEFVMDLIQPKLEKEPDPPFKLCIHSRDFHVGLHIFDNIQEAIENSNSAIIVMSQDFVKSCWCKEEFAHCYMENMNDPAFRLFVIMRQTPDTLVNPSRYIRKFIDQKTYLDKDDPDLIEKIVRYLRWVKQPKKNATNNKDEANEPEEAERFIE